MLGACCVVSRVVVVLVVEVVGVVVVVVMADKGAGPLTCSSWHSPGGYPELYLQS